MANYYCLMAGLPDITLGHDVPVTLDDMREELDMTLTDRDKKLIYYFFLEYDCRNLVKLLKNPEAEIDFYGNLSREQLEDLMTSAREMNFNVHRYPSFMSEFARSYDYNREKEGWFAEDAMLYAYYEYAAKCPDRMMSEWYSLNLDICNILTAMTARKYGWNVADYIQGDNEVTEMIRTNTTRDFDLSVEYDYVKELMQIVDCGDPVEKERRIDAFKWNWLDEQTFFETFSIDAVFAYLCKLCMLTRWEMLDPEKGQQTFRQIINNLRGEAKVPEEFTTYMPKASD